MKKAKQPIKKAPKTTKATKPVDKLKIAIMAGIPEEMPVKKKGKTKPKIPVKKKKK